MSRAGSFVKGSLKLIILAAAMVAIGLGIVMGEWSETMFNATLL